MNTALQTETAGPEGPAATAAHHGVTTGVDSSTVVVGVPADPQVLHRGELFPVATARDLAVWCSNHRAPDTKPVGSAYTDKLAWLLTLNDSFDGGHPCHSTKKGFHVAWTHGCSFDLDGPAGHEITDTLEVVEAAGYGAVFWRSHNNTPENPAGRLLVLHAPCPAEKHAAVYETLRLLLCPKAPASQHNPNRGFNLPRAGVAITVVCDGPLLDWTALELVAPNTLADADTTTADVEPSPVQLTEYDTIMVKTLMSAWQPNMSGHMSWWALGGIMYKMGVSEERATAIVSSLADAVCSTHENEVDRALEAYNGVPGVGTFPMLKRQLAKHAGEASANTAVNQLENYLRVSVAAPTPAPGGQANDNAGAPAPAPEKRLGDDSFVNEIITNLSTPDIGVFQRAGHLCTVTRDAVELAGMIRPAGAPTIRELSLVRLKEIIRTACGARNASLAADVLARGEWSDIRPLDAIVTYPIMRRDGTLLLTNGYDAATRTLAEIDVQVQVPDAPTQADARAALALLTDLVSDFPFATEQHRSAWLAMLLTVPARPAIKGPTPLGLLEASMRSSGKSLLADLISVIVTGSEASRRVAPKTKEEWDKTLLSVLLAGAPLVLFDNVVNMLSSDALDAVLTGETYTQRLLGVSEDRRVAIRTVFLVSVNNARLSTDLVRRSLGCRLEPSVERPETRTGFRYPDLLDHAGAHRAELLGAVLTILRAYTVAGRPAMGARPMGSYSAWCRVVRDALVWAGGTDPAVTQDALRESSDVERDELRDLLTAWHAVIGDNAVTTRDLIEAARGMTGDAALLDALRGIMPNAAEPTSHAIGNRLRSFRGSIVGGLAIQEGARNRTNTATWRVYRND